MSDQERICFYKQQQQAQSKTFENHNNNGRTTTTTTTTTIKFENELIKKHKICSRARARARKRRCENKEEAGEDLTENEKEIVQEVVDVVKQEVSGRKSLIVTTNCNYNLNANYDCNKINQAFNTMKTNQTTTTTATKTNTMAMTVNMLSNVIATTTTTTTPKTTKTKTTTLLSILSRVFLFSLLFLFSIPKTTTTTIYRANAGHSLATTAGTLLAMHMLPIKLTTATIMTTITTTTTLKNYDNDDFDKSTTADLRQSRQLQQQQLFALLTPKQQQQKQQQQQPDIIKEQSHESIIVGREHLRKSRGGGLMPGLPFDLENDDEDDDNIDVDNMGIVGGGGSSNSGGVIEDDDDDDDEDVNALSLKLIEDYAQKSRNSLKKKLNKNNSNHFLETSGFVADDGQQYEKVTSSTNNNNLSSQQQNIFAAANTEHCPRSCKCLDDFFNCGKLQLETVPKLPDYVEHLDLVGNRLNEFTAAKIQNLSSLHKLSLKRNQLENMPKFVGLSVLKHLNLANNRIKRIDSAALLALPKLKSLDLTRNNLHNIEANFFPANYHLAHLILNSNEISAVDEHAFEHLSDLLDLELNNNRLTSLPGGVFKNLSKLRKLSLNFNQLEINWSTFRGLVSLQKLFLKSNRIKVLQDGVFHVMRGIETIELDHNGITSLSKQGLFNLTKLHHLSLSNNSISRIELDTWEFTQSLITLDLSHNNITDFRPQHLDCLHRLRHLNLGHNRLQYLMENTFDCAKNLEELILRRNQLSWIIEDPIALPPFRLLRKLKKLDLFGNNLKQIRLKSFMGLNSLETLNLGGNPLASIQSNAFEHLTHLQKLMFKSPNFICDCELFWFRLWLGRHAQGLNVALQSNAVCGYPAHLLDRELLDLNESELICAESPKPVITHEPSDQLAVKGANITMECIATSPAAGSLGAPADELKIKWRHENQNVRERQTHTLSSAAVASPVSSGSMLAFANNKNHNHHQRDDTTKSYSYTTTDMKVVIDAATNQTIITSYLKLYNVSYESAGRYQCVVSNSFATTYSQKFKISIGIHPTFLQIPSNMTIDSGDTARLVCSATGDPMPEIALQKVGASDFPAATERRLQVIREENAFIIMNAKPIDTGVYTCTAESAAGEIKINASLVVNDKPLPHIPTVHKEVVLGQSSVLKCLNDLTADLAKPRREWFKDNKPFHSSSTSDSERYYFTGEKEFLVIDDTQSMDAGHYRCEIHDQAKNYIMHMELLVVQAGFSQNVIITGVVLLTIVCIIIGSMVVWCLTYYQKRKLHMSANGARVGQLSMLGSRRQSAVLDQTQLTTLNRTYLRQQTPQHLQLQERQRKQQLRPHSLADLEFGVNGMNRGLLSITPNEQLSRLLVNNEAVDKQASSPSRPMETLPLTLDYLEQHQECSKDSVTGSSKDSGTGSDAAAKRSIDDFTLTALAVSNTEEHNLLASTPAKVRRATLARLDTYDDENDDLTLKLNKSDKAEVEEDEDSDFMASQTVGVSLYEVDSPCHQSSRFSTHNVIGLPIAPTQQPEHKTAMNNSCKGNVSLNGSAVNIATAQAVDI